VAPQPFEPLTSIGRYSPTVRCRSQPGVNPSLARGVIRTLQQGNLRRKSRDAQPTRSCHSGISVLSHTRLVIQPE
jgi:hypothetical protein